MHDSKYCKVFIIAYYDMQSKDTTIETVFWKNLNVVMAENSVLDISFKGFMADSAQANWIVVQKLYR